MPALEVLYTRETPQTTRRANLQAFRESDLEMAEEITMTARRFTFSALALAALGGCAIVPTEPAPYPYPYPYASAPAPATVWIESPAPVYQVVPPSPYVGGIWIEGTWVQDRGRRVWQPGRWTPPGHEHRNPPPRYRDPPPREGRPWPVPRPGFDDRGRPPGRGGDDRGIAPAWGTPGGAPPAPVAREPREPRGEHRMRIPRQPETAP